MENTENQNDNSPEGLAKQLKTILPQIINFKDILGQAKEKFTATDANVDAVKNLTGQLKNIEGNIDTMGKKIIELGNKAVTVHSSGLSFEQKLDFAKFFIGVFKANKRPEQAAFAAIKALQEKYGVKAMTEGTGSSGGYFVPKMFTDTIWRAAEQASIGLRDATSIPLTSGYKLPLTSLGTTVAVTWKGEGTAFDASQPVIANSEIAAKKMGAYTLINNELMEDEEVGLVDFLVTIFGEAVGKAIDVEVFQGDGTNFTGVLAAAGTNNVDQASTKIAFSDVTFDYLSQMMAAIKPSLRMNAKWYLHRTITQYLRALKGADNYFWAPPSAGIPGTIWGYPYEEVEQMPTSADTAVSKKYVVFGSLKNYAIGTKGEMSVEFSNQLKIVEDQTVMVVKRRIALATALPSAFCTLKTAAS